MTLTDLHIGLAIKAARTSVGVSARDLARAVNMNPTAISKIENGRQGVSFAEAVAIANVLGLTAGDLADLAAQAGPLARSTYQRTPSAAALHS